MNNLSTFKKLLKELHFYYDYYAYTVESPETLSRVEHYASLVDKQITLLVPELDTPEELRWATQYQDFRKSFKIHNSNYYHVTMSTYKHQYMRLIDTLDTLVDSINREHWRLMFPSTPKH